MGVKAQMVDDTDNAPAGAFEYYKSGDREYAGMIYCCPCGCGKIGVFLCPHCKELQDAASAHANKLWSTIEEKFATSRFS